MDQVHVVRHKVLVEGQPARRVAREMGLSRNTVKRYLELAAPVRVEHAARVRPVWEKVGARIEALLSESPKWTGGKQRLTATRLHAMVVSEGFEVGVTTVKDAVAEWKRRRREVFVPLVYPAGDLAEVDFFEVLVDLSGKRQKAWMFVMRLMHSGRDFAWIYTRQDQVSFLDGHVRAFEHFGAVPVRIAYDNLKAAVTKVLVGSERQLAVDSRRSRRTTCSSLASVGHAPGTTRAASSRVAKPSVGNTSCRFPTATTWTRCALRSSRAWIQHTTRSDSSSTAGRCCRCQLAASALARRTHQACRSARSFASREQFTRCHASGRGWMSPHMLAPTTSRSRGQTAYSDVIRSPFRRHPITIPDASDQGSGAIRS